MIKLLDNWKELIQLRDWMSPISEYGEVAILIFALKNKDNQIWIFQENNKDYPLTLSKITSKDEKVKVETLKKMYDRIIYHLPAISVLQDTVISYKNGEHYEPITNDEWENFPLEGLKPYDPR